MLQQAEDAISKMRINGLPSAELKRICRKGIRISVKASEYYIMEREPLYMVLDRQIKVPVFYDGVGEDSIEVLPNKRLNEALITIEVVN